LILNGGSCNKKDKKTFLLFFYNLKDFFRYNKKKEFFAAQKNNLTFSPTFFSNGKLTGAETTFVQ